ncbi:MAG: JAB domain-containing protein, partial [Methylococcaceae bacterium]
IYPREVAKRALFHNAAAVIFAHNHPSGINKPSQADKQITETLKQSLSLFDIKVLDHFIIGDGQPYSFAEHGLI